MMRRRDLWATTTHNICIFCATRLTPPAVPPSLLSSKNPTASANNVRQSRSISCSRQHWASEPQLQQPPRNDDRHVDPERAALLQQYVRLPLQERQQRPPETPSRAKTLDPERAALMASFARTSSSSSPSTRRQSGAELQIKRIVGTPGSPVGQKSRVPTPGPTSTLKAAAAPAAATTTAGSEDNGLRIKYTGHRYLQQPPRQYRGPRAENAPLPPSIASPAPTDYKIRVEYASHRTSQLPVDTAEFDADKVSQWRHLKPRSAQPQQQQAQPSDRIGGIARKPWSNKGFVSLRPGQGHVDKERTLRRFSPAVSVGSDTERPLQQQNSTRPTRTEGRPSSPTGDAGIDALRAAFAKPYPPQPSSMAQAKSTFVSSTRDPEADALKAVFGKPQQPPPLLSPRTRTEPQGEQVHGHDVIIRQVSQQVPVTENATPAQSSESPDSEVQAQTSKQVNGSDTARARDRARVSKYAFTEDGDAPRRQKGRGSWNSASDYDEDAVDLDRIERKTKRKEKKNKERAAQLAMPTPISLPEYVTVVSLANMLRVRTEDLIRRMDGFGYEDVKNDDVLNSEHAGLIAMEYNFEPVAPNSAKDLDLYPALEPDDKSVLPPRPPVVTIMGHVDHGKTTLLDFLRKSSVAATEFGGITQHIGAFSVPLSSGKTITFLDTPGHAAFLNMRQRGANVTDIVILVVAADDGVKPQTIEAIRHARAARVPMIVAINKTDKEGADPERVKQDLARHGVDVEEYGGDVQAICVSGKTGQGMQDLEEAAITLSEILDHRADPEGAVEGWVLEATTKKSGKVATVLVRRGTLTVGSILVAGRAFARVRSIRNEAGAGIPSVGPGMPAEIDGWRGTPEAGDEVIQAADEQRATEVVAFREANAERVRLARDMEAIGEARRLEHEKREREAAALAAAAMKVNEQEPNTTKADGEAARPDGGVDAVATATPGPVSVPFVVKADVSGSVEAVVDYVMTVGNGEVRALVIRTGVGAVSESDVELAATAGGHIVAFNTALEPRLARVADTQGVRVLEQNVIYRLVDDVKALLSERLAPSVTQRVSGEATVLEVFSISLGRKQTAKVAGCRVGNGAVTRGSKVRVVRGEEKVYDGTVSSLKRGKKDVSEMRRGNECGMAFEDWGGFQTGDTIQCYDERFEKRSL